MLLLGNKNVKPKILIIKDNENSISYNDMYIESENKCINRNNITKQIFNQYSNLFYAGFRSRETWPCHLYHKIKINHEIFVLKKNNSLVLRREIIHLLPQLIAQSSHFSTCSLFHISHYSLLVFLLGFSLNDDV